MTAGQIAAWSGLAQVRVDEFLHGDASDSGSPRSRAVGRAFAVEPAAFVDFWRSVECYPKRLIVERVEMQTVDFAHELRSQDAGALAIIEEIAEKMADGRAVDPVKLMAVPGEPHRIIDGRKRCCAAWKCGREVLPAYVVPHSPAVLAWLDLQSARGKRALHERPAEYVGRIFAALPEYEEAVASGAISYRQVRDALRLESHLPVFRVIRKRRRGESSESAPLGTADGISHAGLAQLRAAIASWGQLCKKDSGAFGGPHYEALAQIHKAAAVLLDAR